MKSILSFFPLLLLSSCYFNAEIRRPLRPNVVDIEPVAAKFIKSLQPACDTLIELTSGDCHPESDDYKIIIYKLNGQTHSKAFSTYGYFEKESEHPDFDWKLIYNSLDSILTQKPVLTRLIENGDTLWLEKGRPTCGTDWSIKVMFPSREIKWETDWGSDNNKLSKAIVTDYLLTQTQNKVYSGLYGKHKVKKQSLFKWK